VSRNTAAEVLNAANVASSGWDEWKELTGRRVYQQFLFLGRNEHKSMFTQLD